MATTTETEAQVTVAAWVPVSVARELRARAAEGIAPSPPRFAGRVMRHLKPTERSGG